MAEDVAAVEEAQTDDASAAEASETPAEEEGESKE